MLKSAALLVSMMVGQLAQSDSVPKFGLVVDAGFEPVHALNYEAGGIAVADFNGNGYPDIFVTGGYHPNRLYFNQGDGTFIDDNAINTMLSGEHCGVAAAADYDNDGWPDIYVACRLSGNHLFRNLKGNSFEDVTPPELKHILDDPTRPTRTDAIAWGDLTGNGLLDLFIGVFTGWQDDLPENYNRIMLNNGDGTWTNAAEQLDKQTLNRETLAVAMSDLTGTGYPDIYVVNDKLSGNVLWQNNGPGCDSICLTDVAKNVDAYVEAYGMGIAIGDVDLDGQWDLYFSSIDEQHLLRGTSQDPLRFSEDTGSVLNYIGVGWATIFSDFNNSQYEDAYLAIGAGTFSSTRNEDAVFLNLGDGTFQVIGRESGLHHDIPSNAAARIDFDRDGRMDLVVHHLNNGYRLYRNVTESTGNWIGFELTGGGPVNRDAIGTVIKIQTPDNKIQRRELRAGESRGASHDRTLHFGLGTHSSAQVTVHWSDGLIELLGEKSANQYFQITHPEGDSGDPALDLIWCDRFESGSNDFHCQDGD
jgi:enediyne biosynthesis protein E4